MVYIREGLPIKLEWTVLKGVSREKEDFSRADITLFLLSCRGEIAVPVSGDDGVLYADIPPVLPEGVYGVKAVWFKDRTRCKMAQSVKAELFTVSNHLDNAEGYKKVLLTTNAATYGYDGLSAYEKSVMLGKTTLTEEEWLDSKNDVTLLIAGVKAEMRELLGKVHKAMTQEEYDELAYVDDETVYFIIGEEDGYEAIYFAGRKFEGGSKGPKEIGPEYDIPTIALAYGTAGSSAGTLTPTVTIKQKWRKKYDNGTAAEQTELVYSLGNMPEGAEHSFSLSGAHADGVSVNAETGELVYNKATSTSQQTIATVVLSVTVNGKTGTASKGIVQSGGQNSIVKTILGDLTITAGSFVYGTNANADAGSKRKPSKTPTFSIPVENVMSIGGTQAGTPITSGAKISYAITDNKGNTGVTINEDNGEITWDANTSTTATRSVVVTATITYKGKGDQSVEANQTANNVATITATATQDKKAEQVKYGWFMLDSRPTDENIADSVSSNASSATSAPVVLHDTTNHTGIYSTISDEENGKYAVHYFLLPVSLGSERKVQQCFLAATGQPKDEDLSGGYGVCNGVEKTIDGTECLVYAYAARNGGERVDFVINNK